VTVSVMLVSVAGTLDLVGRSGWGITEKQIGRGGASKLRSLEMRKVQDKLSAIKDQDVFIVYEDDFHQGGFINGWLAYFARKNRLVLANSYVGASTITQVTPLSEKGWNDSLLLTTYPAEWTAGSIEKDWCYSGIQCFRLFRNDWAFVFRIRNPNGLELHNGNMFFWLSGDDTRMKIFAGKKGILTFRANLIAGPSLDTTSTRNVFLKSPNGPQRNIRFDRQCTIELEIPVSQGLNEIQMACTDHANVSRLSNGDPRPLLVYVGNFELLGLN